MKLRIAGYDRESVVDGPGIRFVVFAQGCPHRCEGCHNPETWDYAGGQELDEKELMDLIRGSRLLKGVTFSGGEPFSQAGAFASLGRQVKEMGLDIVTYTGYTFEEVLAKAGEDENFKALLDVTDILVDGKYLAAERDISISYRGSRNQRVILVPASLAAGEIIQAKG